MFFYYFDIETTELIKHCFNRYVKRSFEIKGYCDVSVLFSDSYSKKNILDSIGIHSERVTALYKEKFPNSKDDLYVVSNIFADKYNYSIIDNKECFEELTPAILNDMVKAVYVQKPDKSSGKRVQKVIISYNYAGILPNELLNKFYSRCTQKETA